MFVRDVEASDRFAELADVGLEICRIGREKLSINHEQLALEFDNVAGNSKSRCRRNQSMDSDIWRGLDNLSKGVRAGILLCVCRNGVTNIPAKKVDVRRPRVSNFFMMSSKVFEQAYRICQMMIAVQDRIWDS
ncbi:hypothetical protein UNDYM_1786 [Undibacterium sp. YM2]|nr:hypothetical protein UNDYM_1786 [Undibacterium sp. YM2]